MPWLKEVLVDILVTLFIAAAWWLQDVWMWWVLLIYSILLLIAKAAVLKGDGLLRRTQQKQQAPDWFLHILYAINVVLLAMAGWWILTGGWVIIWILSWMGQRR